MKKSINPNNGTALFNFHGKDLEISLAGMDNVTICYLALYGAHEILNKRVSPTQSWADIRNGKLHQDKKQPTIIKAIAQVHDITHKEAQDIWISLTAKEKRALRKDSRIKMAFITLGEQVEIDLPDFLGDNNV
jgi:hypothetical protein